MVADNGLRRIVQQHLKKPDWLWTPIETGVTQAGVPDSFWAHEDTRTSGWIEHKSTNGWAVEVRPHQVGWVERHVRAGVHCTFMIRAGGVGSTRERGDSLWVVAGWAVRELAANGLGDLPKKAILGFWAGPPAEWNWRVVQQILTHSH
jgi:hypothetical protein